MKKHRKIAIILLNLGGPDSLASVKSFLFNLFYDRAIINLPNPLRFIIAKLISTLRNKKAQDIYSHMGGKSPILAETQGQAVALSKMVSEVAEFDHRVFVSMRYWKPFSKDIILSVLQYDPQQIILVPLYPQFSTTTTASSIDDFNEVLKFYKYKGAVKALGCYFLDQGFIDSHVKLLKNSLDKMKDDNFIVLFSAHGLPVSVIKNGDPYQWQIQQTTDKVALAAGLNNNQYMITYQSRVGPVQWLKPNTEDVIKMVAASGKNLIIVPISFVSEHSETLVELDIEYKAIADEHGVEYHRVPTLRTDENFIESLTKNVVNLVEDPKVSITSDQKVRLCPPNFSKCICRG
jgi:ferrochelatase